MQRYRIGQLMTHHIKIFRDLNASRWEVVVGGGGGGDAKCTFACHGDKMLKQVTQNLAGSYGLGDEHNRTGRGNHNIPLSNVLQTVFYILYSKTCLKRPLKNRQNEGLIDFNDSLTVKSIAECSPWSILQ